MSAVETLKAARELISRPYGWMQGSYNRSASGERNVDRNQAECWCAEGAVFHAAGIEVTDDFEYAALPFRFLTKSMGVDSIPFWNDVYERTQAEVIAAFDRAIALAESEATS